jgi:hypothetical protein
VKEKGVQERPISDIETQVVVIQNAIVANLVVPRILWNTSGHHLEYQAPKFEQSMRGLGRSRGIAREREAGRGK